MTKDKRRDLKVIWSSNAPWGFSGYSTQTKHILCRMAEDGWPVSASCFYGLEGGIIQWHSEDERFKNLEITCYPKIGEAYGSDALRMHSQHYNADIMMGYQDIWVMNPNHIQNGRPWIPYVPIDYNPIPQPILNMLKYAYKIVVVSKFGQDALSHEGYNSTYIPNGVDTSIFKPGDQWAARQKFGLDKTGVDKDTFLFGMIAANKDLPPRKSFQKVLEAFTEIKRKYPQKKIAIFFHTLIDNNGGFNIMQYAQFLGVDKFVYNLPPYDLLFKMKPSDVADLINSFDVLLAPSTAEGFGLPIIEAQACGKPVVVNNFTAMPELVVPGETGFVTEVSERRWVPVGGYMAEPKLESLIDCMDRVYNIDKKLVETKAVEHIKKNYDMDMLYTTKWLPYLEQLQQEIKGGE